MLFLKKFRRAKPAFLKYQTAKKNTKKTAQKIKIQKKSKLRNPDE
jgi:hypothetical protein